MTEKLCDACGAVGEKGPYMMASVGAGIHLCEEHACKTTTVQCIRLIRARRAAQKPATEPAPLAVGQTVDPRVLPVGAEFRYKWGPELAVHRVVESRIAGNGGASVLLATGERMPFGTDPAIILSLPEQEVELGTLAEGDHFKFAPREIDGTDGVPVFGPTGKLGEGWRDRVAVVVRAGIRPVIQRLDYTMSTNSNNTRRVIRVPAPSSAGSVESVTGNTTGAAKGYDSLPDAVLSNSTESDLPSRKARCACGHVQDRAFSTCLGCGKATEPATPRWPNTPAEHHARLDALLAEQVASGGQDCAPARSLIERADRLRREAEAEESARSCRIMVRSKFYQTQHSWLAQQGAEKQHIDGSPRSLISGLKLERPLISYKRGR